MSLIEFPDVVQGSDEWYDQRRGMVTASVIGTLVTPKTVKVAENVHSRALTALIASERITGWTDPTYLGDDMIRGHDDEPRAIEAYANHFGTPATTTGFMVRDDWGFKIGYSPDALVGGDGQVEVKSRRPKIHLQHVVANEVPDEHMAQIQCGLLVSGRAWCDYVSFCSGMELWVKRVTPDQVWFDAIVAAATAIEAAAEQMVATYRSAVAGMPMTERIFYGVELKL